MMGFKQSTPFTWITITTLSLSFAGCSSLSNPFIAETPSSNPPTSTSDSPSTSPNATPSETVEPPEPIAIAQDAPSDLAPLSSVACASSNFYEVTSPDDAPLLIQSDSGDTHAVHDGDLVLLNYATLTGLVEIMTADGFVGQISEDALKPLTFGSDFNGRMQVKTLLPGASVQVRAEPLLNADVVGTLTDGDIVTVPGSVGQWYYIVSQDQMEGYVVNQYLVCPASK